MKNTMLKIVLVSILVSILISACDPTLMNKDSLTNFLNSNATVWIRGGKDVMGIVYYQGSYIVGNASYNGSSWHGSYGKVPVDSVTKLIDLMYARGYTSTTFSQLPSSLKTYVVGQVLSVMATPSSILINMPLFIMPAMPNGVIPEMLKQTPIKG